MLSNLRHKFVILLKRAFYGSRGEPYPVNGRTLRYIAGTRPVRLHYKNSPNANVRFDALQVELLLRGLKAGDTAIDLGAHCGQYCLIMAELCGPTGNVVAFEPDPHARELLEKNLALNPEVKKPTIEAIAISDADGEAILHSRGGNSQSSLARSAVVFSGEQKSEEFRVPTMRLDAYLTQAGLPEPAWVKIDTEGAEIRILKGAPRLLQGPSQIICELHPYAWPEFGDTFAELKALVAGAGRRMRYLGTDCEISGDPTYGTVLIDRA
jgi:FkbM family methyltransferase